MSVEEMGVVVLALLTKIAEAHGCTVSEEIAGLAETWAQVDGDNNNNLPVVDVVQGIKPLDWAA